MSNAGLVNMSYAAKEYWDSRYSNLLSNHARALKPRAVANAHLTNDSSTLKSGCDEEVEYEFDWLCSFEDVQPLLMYLLGMQVPDLSGLQAPNLNSINNLICALKHHEVIDQSDAQAETTSTTLKTAMHQELQHTYFVLDLGSGNSTLLRSLCDHVPQVIPIALDYSLEAFRCLLEAEKTQVAPILVHSLPGSIPSQDKEALKDNIFAQRARPQGDQILNQDDMRQKQNGSVHHVTSCALHLNATLHVHMFLVQTQCTM
ncbi:hypothetical protein CEUSTIGMA_g2517.t1 [Chlamydomonas eustigma]|uniref:Uncharacterized protein n=1 Tax=Chlamydomonas eustigma TaxID=1157962 RepID=A0A250WW44_9CHLO|nr:hypothetical protein CEUSTIGMA_g2517.t1 [Chlamydomonas eustigma]|eukprot:GAX75073.1 hypothetical protein CEUSTIGMA_g2517.t1 [Chlamydomonas eustigma]